MDRKQNATAPDAKSDRDVCSLNACRESRRRKYRQHRARDLAHQALRIRERVFKDSSSAVATMRCTNVSLSVTRTRPCPCSPSGPSSLQSSTGCDTAARNSTVKQVPRLAALRTQIAPWCSRTIPEPAERSRPPPLTLAVKKDSKMRARVASMPRPYLGLPA
jgi:hypothetical protein